MSTPVRPLRYVAVNPEQEIPASYNTSLGVKEAARWACYNARQWGGRVLEELNDGSVNIFRDYTPDGRDCWPAAAGAGD